MLTGRSGKDSEGSGHGLIEVLSLHSFGGTEENKSLRITGLPAEFQTEYFANRAKSQPSV
jgi:hypothetical protein